MKKIHSTLLNKALLAALTVSLPAVCAQSATTDFKAEPDKSMAAAHESFIKGDTEKASKDLAKAADFVKQQSEKVAEDSKAGMNKAGDELDKLGDGVKDGTVKSGDEMKKTFAKVDHEIASCWHKTAGDSRKAGKDSTADLKKAGSALENSAKWSGQQLSEGTKASVEALKKAGKGTASAAKASADKVDKWFKDIGDGIDDLGHKL